MMAREHSPSRAEAPEATVEGIFHDQGRFVFRFLRRLGVPDADIDDVVQDVFVVVHRKLPQFDPQSSLRAWVYGICLRSAATYRKRRRSRQELTTGEEIDAPDESSASPIETLDAQKGREILDGILRALPDDKREIFILYVLEELSMPEVALVLGCPLQTAYSRLYAARKLVEDAIRRTRAQMGRP